MEREIAVAALEKDVGPQGFFQIGRFGGNDDVVKFQRQQHFHLLPDRQRQSGAAIAAGAPKLRVIDRAAVGADTDDDPALPRHVDDGRQALGAAHVAGIDADGRAAGLHGRDGERRIEVDVRHQRQRRRSVQGAQSVFQFRLGKRDAHQFAAFGLKFGKLFQTTFRVVEALFQHRFDSNRRAGPQSQGTNPHGSFHERPPR